MEEKKTTDVFEPLTLEIAQNLMKIDGKARGTTFKTDAEYVLREKGEDGLKKVEDRLSVLGFPIKYNDLKAMDFYPIGLRVLSLLAIREVFSFKKEDIRQIGLLASKTSLVMKFFMPYFFSLERTFSLAPQIWEKYYNVGKLVPFEINDKEKFLILKIEGFDIHPIICPYLGGFFSTILKMIIKGPVSCEETKCSFCGGDCHEYLFKWQAGKKK